MTYSLDTRVSLHPLVFLDEADSVTVGRADQDVYVSLPPEGAELLRYLEADHSPAEAVDWYRQTYGEHVDIDDFLVSINEVGFLVGDDATFGSQPVRLRGRWLGMVAFSRPAWLCYGLAVAAALAVMIMDPVLAPRPRHLIFAHSVSLVYLVLLAGQIPFVLLHEAFHTLAGRRIGLRSSTRLNHRFLDLVLETSLDGLVAVPRRRRILPIMAGMLIDIVVFSGFTLVAAGFSRVGDHRAAQLCLAMAYATLLRTVWQLFFCMRTDIYYLIMICLGTEDLHSASRWMIGCWIRRLTRSRSGSRFDASHWSPRDLRHARWYAPLMIVGYAVLVINLLVLMGPVTVSLWRTALSRFGGTRSDLTGVLDSSAFLALNVIQLVIAGLVYLHGRRMPTGSAPQRQGRIS